MGLGVTVGRGVVEQGRGTDCVSFWGNYGGGGGLSWRLRTLQGYCGRLEGTVGSGVHCGILLGALWGVGGFAANYRVLWEVGQHCGG